MTRADAVAAIAGRRDRVRILGALVAVLSLAVGTMLLWVGHLAHVADANRAGLLRQQQVIEQLVDEVRAARQDASAQQRLVRALQRQVRHLGGVPLTSPPPQRSRGRTTAPSSTGPAQPSGSPATASPSRSPQPRPSPSSTSPSPRPSHSPSPSPSPSPLVCVPGVRCIHLGGFLGSRPFAW